MSEVICVELLTQSLFEKECIKKESHALESVHNDESVNVSVIEASSPKVEKLLHVEPKPIKSSVEVIKPELKSLPTDLKYVFLGEDEIHLVIISSKLSAVQGKKLIEVIKSHKSVIGWSIADIKGISPLSMHSLHILRRRF